MRSNSDMQRQRKLERKLPPAWWVRCAVIALACLQVIAPTWHICSEGADGPAPGQKMAMAHCACDAPQTSANKNDAVQLNNQPMAMDFCLARMLQHILGNSQFRLVLDFRAATISTLVEHPADAPIIRTLPVQQARGPPSHLL
jgi:hypothetical protein